MKLNTEPLEKFLTEYVGAQYMAQLLERVGFEYMYLLMEHRPEWVDNPEILDAAYHIRQLRMAIEQSIPKDATKAA